MQNTYFIKWLGDQLKIMLHLHTVLKFLLYSLPVVSHCVITAVAGREAGGRGGGGEEGGGEQPQ